MKFRLHFFPLIFVSGIITNLSCKKETSCEGCASKNNKPPISVAGPDQVITLPTDSVLLDGKQSSDPDGIISSYFWTKVSGPASFNILKPTDSITRVKTLMAGTYLFELKVTDNGGLSAKDTMRIIVDPVLTTNHPPIANAGADQTITLPTNAVNLDGSASSDPENNITGYVWTKISGSTSFNIANSNAVTTQVTNLFQGIYQFELKVTDAGGLFSKDTIQVTVNLAINNNCVLSQTLIGSLSIPRSGLLIQSVGNKIVFAGGFVAPNIPTARVDIYDRASQSWSIADLSLARIGMGVITSGSKIYFAGGFYNGSLSSRVDIYDASNNSWSIAELSEARGDVIAITAGNKVLFAGGYNNGTKVDIYDQSNDSWSIATLTKPMTATSFPGYYPSHQSGYISSGNKIYFTGNNISTGSNSVDVYDAASNTWSTNFISPNQFASEMAVSLGNKIFFSGSLQGSTVTDYNYANTLEIYNTPSNSWLSVNMSGPRAYMAGISGDNKIFWAGGFDSSWTVNGEQALRPVGNIEIYDVNTGLHSFHDLQQTEYWIKALKTNNKIFFSYGNFTEIYDMNTHSWTLCSIFLDQAFAIDNSVYQVRPDSRVWQLEF
jgi:uncharacterized membrane protein